MDRIKLVQGDSRPQIFASLADCTTGTPINMSSATVVMFFRATGTTTLIDTLTGSLLPGTLLSTGVVTTTPTTPGAGGRCSFSWNPMTLNQPPGQYEGEIQITFPDNTIQTVFETLKFTLRADF